MILWSCSPIAFTVGDISIYWYGIIYAISLIVSWSIITWIFRLLRSYNSFNSSTNSIYIVPSKEKVDSFMFWAIISILVGARLGHILFYDLEYYLENPIEIFMLRNGGLAFHGSVISLAIYSYIFKKKNNISWKLLSDILCFAASIGVGIGRIANFMNQELYGKICTKDFAVIFNLVDNMPRYPTQLMESIFEGFLNFWIMFVVFKFKGIKVFGTGIMTFIFCIIYSSSRFIIEFFKEVEVFNYFNTIELTVGQILSIAMFLFGFFVLYYKDDSGIIINKQEQ